MDSTEPDSNKKLTIGLLGGMGPAASASMYQELIKKAQNDYGAHMDSDFPAIVLYSLPLSDWDTTGFLHLESVKKQLIDGVKTLERAGVDFIIIGCNTVHHFYEEMQAAVQIPIINMVRETAKAVKAKNMQAVGVLATSSSSRLGVYRKELAMQGVATIPLTLEQQECVTMVISHAEAGCLSVLDTQTLNQISKELAQRGAEGIILGCTELPLVIKACQTDLPLFNSSDIILDRALAASYGKKLEKIPAKMSFMNWESPLKPIESYR